MCREAITARFSARELSFHRGLQNPGSENQQRAFVFIFPQDVMSWLSSWLGIFFFFKLFWWVFLCFTTPWTNGDLMLILLYMVWWCGCFHWTSSLKTHVKGEKIRFTCEATPICQVPEVDFRHQFLRLPLKWPRPWGSPWRTLPSLELCLTVL